MTKVKQKMEPQNAGEFKGTKGEWEYNDEKSQFDNNYEVMAPSDSMYWIARVNGSSFGEEECKANAKIIAAAPEMLSVLLKIVDYEDTWLKSEYELSLLQAAKNAIKKATS